MAESIGFCPFVVLRLNPNTEYPDIAALLPPLRAEARRRAEEPCKIAAAVAILETEDGWRLAAKAREQIARKWKLQEPLCGWQKWDGPSPNYDPTQHRRDGQTADEEETGADAPFSPNHSSPAQQTPARRHRTVTPVDIAENSRTLPRDDSLMSAALSDMESCHTPSISTTAPTSYKRPREDSPDPWCLTSKRNKLEFGGKSLAGAAVAFGEAGSACRSGNGEKQGERKDRNDSCCRW